MAFAMILCFYLFFLSPSLSSSLNPPFCNSHDSSALLQFKHSNSLNRSASIWCDEYFDYHSYTVQFKNSSYPKTASWGSDSNCCLWDGITYDSMSGHVIGLDLSCCWLQGHLHPNSSLFQLSHLQSLNLAWNDFSGSLISSQFGQLSTLKYLNLTSSAFTGETPSKIAYFSKLVSLDLSMNDLRLEPSTWEKLILNMTDLRELVLDYVNMSSISPSSLSLLMNLSSSLVSLRLQDTQLQGNLISYVLCLKNLQQLDLSLNQDLNGQLPKSNWSSPLSLLDLGDTSFSGTMSNSIGQLKYLNHLNLSGCQFEGRVPLGFRNLTQLTYLDISSNKFSGDISFLSNLQHLTFLSLRGNNFVGEIPSEISQMSKLESLDLSWNFGTKESSSLRLEPSTWEKLILNKTNLRVLRLSHVNMSSVTPKSLSQLMNLSSSLIDLSLSKTSLQGNITNSILYFENLKYLDMSGNTNVKVQLPKLNWSSPLIYLQLSGIPFSGELTDSLGHLKFLEVLELRNCQFERPIPPSFKNLTQLISLDLSSNKLSDGVAFLSTLANLTSLYLSNNSFSGQLPSSLGYLEYLHVLDLSMNNFSGGIPDVFGKLSKLLVLDLSSNKLSDGIAFLSKLVNLTSLYLSNNSFSGQFPSPLGNLECLYSLDLSMNNFSGGIPDVLGKLSELQYLELNNNNFSGQVPSSLSNTSVTFLDLSFNKLEGNLPIPFFGAEFFAVSNNKFKGDISFLFCNASSLKILNLSHNNLSGPIPQCLIALSNLSVLDLQMNNFSGTLPNNFSRSNVLQTLHFNNNQLKGSLPMSLGHCTQLEIFDVGQNQIEDTFPCWLDALPELQVLVLRENKFYGAILSSNTKHPFPKLRIFDISNNHFSGSLPTTYIKELKGMMKIDIIEVGAQYMGNKNYSAYKDSVMITWKGYTMELERILTIFTTIDLSNNRFIGEIPNAIGELHALIGLNLSHNKITSSIPKSMGNLTSLEWLDLSCNKIVGEIPQELTNLNFLAVLNLSQNQLEGNIPRGKQFDTFQSDSYEGNVGLCGVPLSKTCNIKDGSSSTFESNEKFGFDWKPVALGYGCGMIFGILMGYVVFSIGKPRWLVKFFGGQPMKQAKRTRRAHAN
ncbi:receptor-like protein 9DC3 [Prosopis cineraria]|uniref:receptor-like protein 9DC3 n=1 Tax=Prosopis cineraria TaxID=364024 RepID=UPI00241043A7|nr:receptor-like protein 9DC3 [Prosopis cineraria]